MAESDNLQPDISIVIVSFNTREVLRQCLQSVEQGSSGLRVEVLVVDNNSGDGSAEMVKEEFPQVRLIESEINLGFGPANNLALKRAKGRYLVLLNSDAFLRPDTLKLATDHMDLQPETGLAGGRLVGRDFSWQPSARMFPGVLSDIFVLTGLAAKYPKSRFFGRFDRSWADPMQPSEVDWVPGAFSIIRADALHSVGYFDPRFFLYAEEVDLCRRIKKAGYRIRYWPDLVVIHVGGESSRQIGSLEMSSSGSQLVLWRMRSSLLYYRKHHGATVWLVKWVELTVYRLAALRNRFSRDPRRKLRRRQNLNLAACMTRAWNETRGGRVSPAQPW